MPRSLYAAFDHFPTRKGASTHIARFAPALFEHTGGGALYVLGDDSMPLLQREQHNGVAVQIHRFAEPIDNPLERALAFSADLAGWLQQHGEHLRLCHFRDPWSGLSILADRERRNSATACVFEVNGLPSIELPQRYPGLTRRTLDKLRAAEMRCLQGSDRIITPSSTTRRLLLELGVDGHKIRVIPNGADLLPEHPRPAEAATRYLLYFGALQAWQGVDTLLQAFARLADLDDLRLVVCGSLYNHDARRCQRLAERLGLADRVQWHWSLSAAELAPWLAHAQLSVAPLRDCARNAVQGCAPLKILESMAAGVPVIASDLAPVREILDDGVEGRLVAADRPSELARAIRLLLAYPELRARMGAAGRRRIAERLGWSHALAALHSVYAELSSAVVPIAPARPATVDLDA